MLRTPDNVQVLVPNAVVFAEVVSNHTYAHVPAPTPGDVDGHTDVVTEQPSPAGPRA
jgi:hypothetical protein